MEQAILKTDILYDELRKEIAQYAAGDKFITSREIMKRYNVSQLIVDRTMSRFRTSGLLRVVPGRGTFVTEEVGRLSAKKPATFLFVLPRWNATDQTLREEHLASIRKKFAPKRILTYYFDYSESVPLNLPLEEENIIGIAMLTSSELWNSDILRRLEEYAARVPLVILERHRGDLRLLSVGVNDTFAGSLAANHLCNLGHKKIAVLVSEPHNGVIRERMIGAVNQAELCGAECRVLDCNVRSGEYALDKTYQYFTRLLEEGIDFTGLIGVCADSFTGAVNACLNAGIRIPDDLSMITVGSKRLAAIQHPPLDCIDTNLEGRTDAVLEILSHPDRFSPENNPYEYFKPQLAINGSAKKLN